MYLSECGTIKLEALKRSRECEEVRIDNRQDLKKEVGGCLLSDHRQDDF